MANEREWPERVYVESENAGPGAQIYDASTHQPMPDVLEVDVHISHADTYVDVTASAHVPVKQWLSLPPEEADKFEHLHGVAVEKRRYHLRKFTGESY